MRATTPALSLRSMPTPFSWKAATTSMNAASLASSTGWVVMKTSMMLGRDSSGILLPSAMMFESGIRSWMSLREVASGTVASTAPAISAAWPSIGSMLTRVSGMSWRPLFARTTSRKKSKFVPEVTAILRPSRSASDFTSGAP